MEINTSLAGVRLRPYQTTISWRRMMNYAAAIGDANPAYFDDTRPQGIISHPMYPVAVTWQIMENIGEYLEGSGLDPALLLTQVHHSEDLYIHRPMRDGDRLVIRGSIATVLPHRAGTRLVLRLDAEDAGGAPVFTEHLGGMLRGVQCKGPAAGEADLPRVPPPPAPDAAPLWSAEVPVDPLLPFVYDGCTDIYFPIHTSPAFAAQVGLPGIIVQGTATLALAVRELVNREAGGRPGDLRSLHCRFSGMVMPGSAIRVQLLERREQSGGAADLLFQVLNQEGRPAIARGHARLEPQENPA